LCTANINNLKVIPSNSTYCHIVTLPAPVVRKWKFNMAVLCCQKELIIFKAIYVQVNKHNKVIYMTVSVILSIKMSSNTKQKSCFWMWYTLRAYREFQLTMLLSFFLYILMCTTGLGNLIMDQNVTLKTAVLLCWLNSNLHTAPSDPVIWWHAAIFHNQGTVTDVRYSGKVRSRIAGTIEREWGSVYTNAQH